MKQFNSPPREIEVEDDARILRNDEFVHTTEKSMSGSSSSFQVNEDKFIEEGDLVKGISSGFSNKDLQDASSSNEDESLPESDEPDNTLKFSDEQDELLKLSS